MRPVFHGPQARDASQTIRRAIEIRDGVIQNSRILSFQHRSPGYPHTSGQQKGAQATSGT